MHSIVTTFRETVIKVEVANFGAAMDTLIDQDGCMLSDGTNKHNCFISAYEYQSTQLVMSV